MSTSLILTYYENSFICQKLIYKTAICKFPFTQTFQSSMLSFKCCKKKKNCICRKIPFHSISMVFFLSVSCATKQSMLSIMRHWTSSEKYACMTLQPEWSYERKLHSCDKGCAAAFCANNIETLRRNLLLLKNIAFNSSNLSMFFVTYS